MLHTLPRPLLQQLRLQQKDRNLLQMKPTQAVTMVVRSFLCFWIRNCSMEFSRTSSAVWFGGVNSGANLELPHLRSGNSASSSMQDQFSRLCSWHSGIPGKLSEESSPHSSWNWMISSAAFSCGNRGRRSRRARLQRWKLTSPPPVKQNLKKKKRKKRKKQRSQGSLLRSRRRRRGSESVLGSWTVRRNTMSRSSSC